MTEEWKWEEDLYEESNPPPRKKKIKLITPDVSASLDRCKVSDSAAMLICSALAQRLGLCLNDMSVSCSMLRIARIKHRQLFSEKIEENFKPLCKLQLQWDGKLMIDPENRIAKLISFRL